MVILLVGLILMFSGGFLKMQGMNDVCFKLVIAGAAIKGIGLAALGGLLVKSALTKTVAT